MSRWQENGVDQLIYSTAGLRNMNEREKDLALKDGTGISIVPGKYQQVYSAYKDEIDCFLRAYILLRNVPRINMERDKAGGNYGRYFFPTSEFNILLAMNTIRRRIKPGKEPFSYQNLRDMVSDAPFCKISVNSMIYESAKENRYKVGGRDTGLDVPSEADNKILAVEGIDFSHIEEIFAKENEPTEQVPKPKLNTVSDFLTFVFGIKRAKRLYDLGNLHFDLFWSTPTPVEAEAFCNSSITSVKSRVASLQFSSMLQDGLLGNTSFLKYLSDLDCENFPVYPVDQLQFNTGSNQNPTLKGYLVHRSIADDIRAVANPNILNIIWSSQEYSKIRGQIDELSEKLRFIEDIQSTVLTSSIHENQYACTDLIEELVSEGVVTQTKLKNIRLNEQHPDSRYLDRKRDETTSKMRELFRNFFELPLSEISEIQYVPEGIGPSGFLSE